MGARKKAKPVGVVPAPPVLLAVPSVEVIRAGGGEYRWNIKMYDANIDRAMKKVIAIDRQLRKEYHSGA